MGMSRRIYYFLFGIASTLLCGSLFLNYSPSGSTVQLDFQELSRSNLYEYICKNESFFDNEITSSENKPNEYYEELNSLFLCDNTPKAKYLSQRGQYYVIHNFIPAEKEFGCTESITLTSPGDFRFLDNVIPLVDRWQGPISIALYTPGYDFETTKLSIAYLRQCETSLIKELVTFHVFFDMDHLPERKNNVSLIDSYEDIYNCSLPPPWETIVDEDTYKAKNSLLFPINIARNVAKLAAKTYFVFPSDIELYPTRNFIKLFLDFVKENLQLFAEDSRNVFVLPIFEILEEQNVPENKTELMRMLKKKTAMVFHQQLCIVCHRVIASEKWVKAEETTGLGVFSKGKREGRYMVWEPFYICTQKEPLWDERFTWEGQQNKMVQAFEMCLLNYDFNVLDNAFLIHKPGVKKKKVQMQKFNNVVSKSNKLMKKVGIELQKIYGYRANCSTIYKPIKRAPVNTR